jgi:hypothetical protein
MADSGGPEAMALLASFRKDGKMHAAVRNDM